MQKRKELISKSGRCFRCLAAGHHSRDCRRARKCTVDGCQSDQHTSYLHESNIRRIATNANQTMSPERPAFHPRQPSAADAQTGQPGGQDTNTPRTDPTTQERSHKTSKADNVSLMVLPALINNGHKSLKVNVMLDPCSTGSYISKSAAGELELQGQSLDLTIAGTGGTEIKKHSRLVDLFVTSLNGEFTAPLQAHVLDNFASNTPAFQWSTLKVNWPHLRKVPFENVAKRRFIDVMIGSDHPLFHVALREIHEDPIARLTNLGWVCFGPTLVEQFRQRSQSHFTRAYRSCQVSTESPPDDVLRKFWELESIGIKDGFHPQMTSDEKAATTRVVQTLTFESGHYTVGIPWKEGEPTLENNYDAALTRLRSQEKAFKRKGTDIMNAYSHVFEEYERKGYIKKVKRSESKAQWLLPHFPVIRPEKDTTKVRVVFDAAMKCEGKSLNDAIRPGPKLQREVVDVLTRFRRALIALTADVSEMFLQVGVRDEDRPYHRFLWRDFDDSREPDVYEFQRLLFGNAASPFCSQYVLHSHAQAHKSKFPEAAESVDNSMYVDDLLDSTETIQSAQQLQSQLTDMLSMASFNLRKWASNEPEVIDSIPMSDRLPGVHINDKDPFRTKTLGVTWEAARDVFVFHVKQPDMSITPIKRNVLSAIASLYDPLQFLAPFAVRAKILMQEIWTAGLDWDDALPCHLKAKWLAWVTELPDLSQIAIPRSLRLPDPESVNLHLFADASKDAYVYAAYLVCHYTHSPSTSRLVGSKCRVSPLKAVTIPRLELMGAVLSSRLARSVLNVLTVDRVIYWTDSENVYYWVRNQSREFKPFVANRIGEIQRTTSPEQWRHVPGTDNLADLPTRGMSVGDLSKSTFLIEGPPFLK